MKNVKCNRNINYCDFDGRDVLPRKEEKSIILEINDNKNFPYKVKVSV